MPRRTISGGSAPTVLDADVNAGASAFTGTDFSTWEDGSGGKIGAVIDRGQSNEERVWFSSIVGNVASIDSGDRGADGTTAVSHSAGAIIEHVVMATDIDEANAHIYDTTRDDHTHYLNNARHDATARHTLGTVIPVSVASPQTIVPGASGSAGDTNAAARSNHSHPVGVAAATTITGSNGAGSGNNFARSNHDHAIGPSTIGSSQLQTNAVTNTKVADGTLAKEKMAFDVAVGDVEIDLGPADTNQANSSSYTNYCTQTITIEHRGVLLITPEMSLRAQAGTVGNFDWKARIRVDGADHPRDAGYGVIDGWIENTHNDQANTHFVCPTLAWPVDVGTATVTLDFQVSLGSAGDVNVRDPKLKLCELNFG